MVTNALTLTALWTPSAGAAGFRDLAEGEDAASLLPLTAIEKAEDVELPAGYVGWRLEFKPALAEGADVGKWAQVSMESNKIFVRHAASFLVLKANGEGVVTTDAGLKDVKAVDSETVSLVVPVEDTAENVDQFFILGVRE